MRRISKHILRLITWIIESIYPIFSRILAPKIYNFCAIGGICFGTNLLVFYISLNFIFVHPLIFGEKIIVAPHVIAWLLAQAISIPIGFYLNYNIVFPTSTLSIKNQLFRFITSNLINLSFSYVLIRIMIEIFSIQSQISAIITLILSVVCSYLLQANFVFTKTQQIDD